VITITLTLANGTTYSKEFATLPRHWRSVGLRLAPYGTDLLGARLSR